MPNGFSVAGQKTLFFIYSFSCLQCRRELKIQNYKGFLLTRNWRDTLSGIEIEYWFTTDQGPIQVLIQDVKGVFFLESESLPLARRFINIAPDVEIQDLELRSFAMKPVVGIYYRSYRAARRLSEQLVEAGLEPLEFDINPADRYLMERFVSGSAEIRGTPVNKGDYIRLVDPQVQKSNYRPDFRVVSFDIETSMEKLELFSIAVHGVSGKSEDKKVFMLGEGADQNYVKACHSQAHLFQEFLDWIAAYDPDVIIGWNVVGFDCNYLQKVADNIGKKLVLGRNRQPLHWGSRDKAGEVTWARCPGRVIIDGIDLLKAAFYRFESFSLENVSRQLLGDGKLIASSDRGSEIGRLFQENKRALAEYNLRDCELVSDIFAHTQLLDFAVARSTMTGLNLDRMGGSVASFENLYLPRLHRAGYVAPNASIDQISSPGGFVLDSRPGIYDHVLVLDFKSLYPSIIRTFAIDPLGLALGISEELPEDDLIEGFVGALFAKSGHILPDLITDLWAQRDAAKAANDAPLSQAVKIIMNSFYGVLGSPGCRFFDARLASSITLRGHQILNETRDHIEEIGHRVIYGDTDSLFVWIQDVQCDREAEAAGRVLEKNLNTWWKRRISQEFGLESALEVEFETHYKRFLMPTIRGSDKGSKKRYAGITTSKDGESLVFKGLENVRSDWTRLARDFQKELYRRVFAGEDYEDYIREVTQQVLSGERNQDLVYNRRLRKPLGDYQKTIPPHVKAGRQYEKRGLKPPRKGQSISYVITSSGAEPAQTPLAPIDYEHYIERQLEPVADGILCFLGTSYSDLVGPQSDLFHS